MFDIQQRQGHTRSTQYHRDHHQSNDEHQGQDANDDIINATQGGRRGQQFIKVCQLLQAMSHAQPRTTALLIGFLQRITVVFDPLHIGTELCFGDVPDLLWLACMGVMDAYIHGMLDMAGYLALSIDLQRHVSRLFLNNVMDCAGRAVFTGELESNMDHYGEDSSNSNNNGGRGNWALTMFR
jgi:hypothetical protein